MSKDLIIFLLVLLLTGSILYAIVITVAYYYLASSREFWKDLAFKLSKEYQEKESDE